MFNSSQTNATTLPRTASTALANSDQYGGGLYRSNNKNENYVSSGLHYRNDIVNEQFIRPTYGAYTNNTLPRGPYLQYKFNDQQLNTKKLTKSNDNNNEPQNPYQIERSKSEFIEIPARRLQQTTTLQTNFDDIRPTRDKIPNHGIVQTLGRRRRLASAPNEIQYASTNIAYCNNNKHVNNINPYITSTDINQNKRKTNVDAVGAIHSSKDVKTSDNATNHHLVHSTDSFACISTSSLSSQQPSSVQLSTRDYYQSNEQEIKENDNLQHMHENPEPLSLGTQAPRAGQSNFLKQIQLKNYKMATSLNNYYTKSIASGCIRGQNQYNNGFGHIPLLPPATSIVPPYTTAAVATASTVAAVTTKNRINYVTLSDIVQTKANGLSQAEGWALLCQSVQALQDLFLADTPAISRVLPMVNPFSLQITARGRVVFKVIPTTQIESSDIKVPYLDILNFLSPEFLDSIGTKQLFTESDIEKMWIYSLGITLQKSVASIAVPTVMMENGQIASGASNGIYCVAEQPAQSLPSYNSVSLLNEKNIKNFSITPDATMHRKHYKLSGSFPSLQNVDQLSSLDYVIASMCLENSSQRASLMYLLDIISEYCRCHHQVKPFSHIAMDLFKEVIDANKDLRITSSDDMKFRKCFGEDQKSDTDSGHSSAHGDREFFKDLQINKNDQQLQLKSKLKVIRPSKDEIQKILDLDVNQQKYQTIGYQHQRNYLKNIPSENSGPRIQVNRRKDEILRKRRSTIAVNAVDVDKAIEGAEINRNIGLAKSTNCLNSIDDVNEHLKLNLNTSRSIPDLKSIQFSTLPSLSVRRQTTISSENIKTVPINEVSKRKCPEFIANSSLPVQYIDMVDIKCQHKRTVSVLLLDGRTLKISCNSTTTTAHQVFETVVKSENLAENFFLGICALIGGDFVFLPPELKIYKVAPQIWLNTSKKTNSMDNVIFTLFLRIKFFLPTLRGISSLESRHLLYLQLRKSILESHILCSDDDLINLGGLALQSEIGDFKSMMKNTDYFTISHYLPEGIYQRRMEMAKYLRNSHFAKQGLHAKEAEQNFIRCIQEMKEYGLHLYSAIWTIDDNLSYDVYVAISLQGILIFERLSKVRIDTRMESANNSTNSYQRKLFASFDWLEIENLCFSKFILCVVVRKSESLKAKDNNRIKYKFKMDGRKSYFAFNLASEHHKFYIKLRNSFISLKTLSDELNIPIVMPTAPCTERTKITINSNNYEVTEHSLPSLETSNTENVSDEKQPPMKNCERKPKDGKSKTGSRVKQLKKSMLNDNKLIKLRDKFLKRSKSSTGVHEEKVSNVDYTSKEEVQNKENECPKVQPNDSPSKLLSPNRNRVKMGTRVFSAQFLSKSFENICDNQLDFCPINNADDPDDVDAIQMKDGFRKEFEKAVDVYSHDDRGSDDATSLRSTSMSSLYFSEKLSEKYSESPLPSEAYVIHSSIKSCNDNNFFSLQNETISDSLLDKFNNISSTNMFCERIIRRVTIRKECASDAVLINNNNNVNNINDNNQSRNAIQQKYATLGKMDKSSTTKFHLFHSHESLLPKSELSVTGADRNVQVAKGGNNGLTLGISIVQGTDQQVYIKDLVKNGPGDRSGCQIGDQILAVNGTSLLTLSYAESLKILQNTGNIVELIVSQVLRSPLTIPETVTCESNKCTEIYAKYGKTEVDNGNKNQNTNKPAQHVWHTSTTSTLTSSTAAIASTSTTVPGTIDNVSDVELKNIADCFKHIRTEPTEITIQRQGNKIVENSELNHRLHRQRIAKDDSIENHKQPTDVNLMSTKSMPDLPKIIATIPKQTAPVRTAYPRNMGLSRKYVGPVKYPVTPIRATIGMEMQRLSLLADDDEGQVFI